MGNEKKALLVLLAGLVSATLMTPASFAANPYFSVQVGATWLEDADLDGVDAEFDTGYNVGAAGGYDFGMARLEAELAYRENDFDKLKLGGLSAGADGDMSAFSFMVNGYWDLENATPLTPYLGAGVGVANVEISDLEVAGIDVADDDDTVFAYQLAAGIGFELNQAMILDLGYRYFATEDPEFDSDLGGDFEGEYDSHNVSLGLRMNF